MRLLGSGMYLLRSHFDSSSLLLDHCFLEHGVAALNGEIMQVIVAHYGRRVVVGAWLGDG